MQHSRYLVGETAGEDGVAGELTHVAAGQLPHLTSTQHIIMEPIDPKLLKLTCAAMEYSSISGSLVKWNCSGSSVEREMWRPLAR